MKRNVLKAFVLAAGVVAIMSIAGCEEEKLSNTKMSRLIANENRYLKAEIEKQKKLVAKCQQEKKSLKEKLQEEAPGPIEFLFEQHAKLTKENEELKAQVEELQKEKNNLKDEVMRLKEEVKELRRKPLFRPQPEPL